MSFSGLLLHKLFIFSAWRGLLFMSAYYSSDKMDHVVSSLILSFFPCMLSGQKPSALWKPAMWHLAVCAPPEGQKKPAHFTEMQKAKILQQQQPLVFSSGFECLQQAPTQRQRAETFERACPRRSKAQTPKFTVSKTIFPWMKESRHSEHKPDSRISGLYEVDSISLIHLVFSSLLNLHLGINVARIFSFFRFLVVQTTFKVKKEIKIRGKMKKYQINYFESKGSPFYTFSFVDRLVCILPSCCHYNFY